MQVQPADTVAQTGSLTSRASLVVYVWEVMRISLVLSEILYLANLERGVGT